jgi:hypothetical protein
MEKRIRFVFILLVFFSEAFTHLETSPCSHIFTIQVSDSLTLISPLAEFMYFLRLQIVVLGVLQAPISLTDMFILSIIVGLHGKPSLSLVPWYFA